MNPFCNLANLASRLNAMLLAIALLMGCSGGGGDGGSVSISGAVTYDRVPFSVNIFEGLDFNNIYRLPARGVRVEIIDESGSIIGVATTDNEGAYRVDSIPRNHLVRVRVYAELSKAGLPSWDVKLLDHTSGDAQYVLNGQLASSGSIDSVRDLHAESGWNDVSSSYTGVRAAAPFAILDTIYTGLLRIQEADSQFVLNGLQIFWSPNNNTASDSFADGDIGGTFYRDHQIYVLGQQNSDTDEYDQHVILHEWAHFLEDALFRSDTIGGGHNIFEALDVRLAYAEGLANAISGMILDDPFYRNSFIFAQQQEDFVIDFEDNPSSGSGENTGWFVESSVHSLLYDFYDVGNEGSDNISTGFQPFYDVLISEHYKEESALLSIYPFVDRFRSHAQVDSEAVGRLMRSQNIFGSGSYGEGEVNDGGDASTLPIYINLDVNGSPRQVCTTNDLSFREVNKLGNRRFVRFTALSGFHNINVAYAGVGFTPSNPAFVLHRQGEVQIRIPDPHSAAYNIDEDGVSNGVSLSEGEYIIEVFSRDNVDGRRGTGGRVCFDVSVSH